MIENIPFLGNFYQYAKNLAEAEANQNQTLPDTNVSFGGEEEKTIIDKIGEGAQSLTDQAIINASRIGKAPVDYDAPFMTIGNQSTFMTEDGTTGTSDLGAMRRELLRQNKMTRDEANAARKTGDMILGTVAPAPEDGSTPAFITDPDDPSKKLRRLYSPITGGMLNQYGDLTAQDALMQAVNPATGKTYTEERLVQDLADDSFKTFQQFAASTPQTYARTQEDIAAKEAASKALQASIAQKDEARNLAQRARMLQMKPSELLAMETQAPAPAPQQSMYGAAQLIKALEGFPDAQAAIANQLGISTSTPSVEESTNLIVEPPKEPKLPMMPRPKPKASTDDSVSSLGYDPIPEGSDRANAIIKKAIERNPQASQESIIELLRRRGVIYSPQQTVR